MEQYKCLVIILYVIISVVNIRTNAHSIDNSRNIIQTKKGPLIKETLPILFNSTRSAYELTFGVLLPEKFHGDNGCEINAAIPAIELAIRKLQQPNGLLEEFTIKLVYRDSKSTSTYGSLAAYDLYTKESPGEYNKLCYYFYYYNVNKKTTRNLICHIKNGIF